ncbi:MAG: cation transporter [Ferruginibacter sp.]|nr:cation transporter [Ferruginibacter sp.]
MKSLSIFAAILFSLFTSNLFAQTSVKKETIKVWGNCGMCKSKIEKAAKKAGAKTASWNEETKELKVSYSAKKTSNQKIQEAVAGVGYDTQDFTADDKVYNNLHGCCQYERKAKN